MKADDQRAQKLLALQAAINGNTQPLQELIARQGRAYTDEELEARRLYLSQLSNRPATLQETIAFFGRYEPQDGQSYELPNGMKLYF